MRTYTLKCLFPVPFWDFGILFVEYVLLYGIWFYKIKIKSTQMVKSKLTWFASSASLRYNPKPSISQIIKTKLLGFSWIHMWWNVWFVAHITGDNGSYKKLCANKGRVDSRVPAQDKVEGCACSHPHSNKAPHPWEQMYCHKIRGHGAPHMVVCCISHWSVGML